jgi:hypothetical protein
MQEIVFNPYWSVPNSIKTEEILHYIQKTGGNSFFGGGRWNTNLLQSHSLRINIGGHEVDPLQARLGPRPRARFSFKLSVETVLRQWRGPKGQRNDFRKFANSDDCGRLGRDIHGLGTRRRGR